jgi:uncharacterized lipoprotein YehR (DUF1307 family)
MKYFLIAGLLWLLAACHSNDHSAAFQEHVNSLQLNFKKPYQRTNDRVMDSLRSSRTKELYAAVERKSKESEE